MGEDGAPTTGRTPSQARDAAVRALTRPHDRLFWLYMLHALLAGPFFPLVALVLYFKFHTLTYGFDDEGLSVSWGILFRQENYLSYVKIQDIQVRRGFVERWLGLGTIEIQTAAGSSSAEMMLEGLEDHEAVRDYLYRRMRGHDDDHAPAPAGPGAEASAAPATSEVEVLALLRGITAELEATRQALEARRAP